MKKRPPWFLVPIIVVFAGLVYYASRPSSNSPAPPATSVDAPPTPQAHSNYVPDGYGVAPSTPAAPTRFVDVASAAGLNYQWTLPGTTPRDILDTIGNGCAFLDYNGDGNLDILLVGDHLALFQGDGHGHFVDVTHQTGLDRFQGHYFGCAVGDYDNDGYDDLFITGYQTALLLHNDHGRGFTDVTAQSGIKTGYWSTSAAWGDVDNDGKLDLYVCNYCDFASGNRLCDIFGNGILSACSPGSFAPQKGILYHNDGNGHFTDVTSKWGLQHVNGKDLGAAFADFDGSGRQSLFVANDQVDSNFFLHTNHGYKDIAPMTGTATINDRAYAGMGVDWGDYDNDGKLDLAVMDFQYEDKGIFHNDGDRLFTNKYKELGMRPDSYPWVAFGLKWIDYDNDGWLDLMYTNGEVVDNIAQVMQNDQFLEPTMLYHNDYGKKFDDVRGGLVGDAGRSIVGRGLAIGDYENNGREDALVVDSNGKPLLLHNETEPMGHWIDIRLIGTKSNRDGFGALVTARTADLTQLRLCQSDGSYMSASDPRVHIGLGADQVVKSLTIAWPSGTKDVFSNVAADRVITIVEGKHEIP